MPWAGQTGAVLSPAPWCHRSQLKLTVHLRRHLAACTQRVGRMYSKRSSSEDGPEQRWDWSSVQQLVVLGLGSPETSQPARMQAAFAMMLAQQLLSGLRTPIQACDPVFTPIDKALLAELGWQVRLLAACKLPAACLSKH